MSKGNMLLGFARGKVGSLVFARANGRQITRARADVIKNPQTRAQIIQRIILNTIAQSYSAMSSICDHSFENVPVGQRSMSYFMKVNMDNLRKKIADGQAAGLTTDQIYSFAPLGSKEFYPNNLLISSGQLPRITPLVPEYPNEENYSILGGLAGDTYQDICDAYGLERGDQLTFCMVTYSLLNGASFHYVRVILDPRNADGSEAPMSSIFALNNAPALPNFRNEGTFTKLEYSNGSWLWKTKGQSVFSSAIIVSRQTGEKEWLRSDATLVSHVNAETSGWGFDLETAIEQSQYGFILGSERYLNNAGVGSPAYNVTYSPQVRKVTIGGVEFDTPKSYQVDLDATQVVLNAIQAQDLNPSKTYVLKVMRNDAQNGSDIAISSAGAITATTITGVLGNEYTVDFYEDGVKLATIATLSFVENTAPPEGGGFGGD